MLIHGDCLAIMREMEENSVDSIVTDPPAGIKFMNKSWDSDKGGRDEWIEWMTSVSIECLRVIKPGGHAFVWSIPRTSHWTGTAWENGGWQPREKIYHLFSTGFPKSMNVGKAFERAGKSNEWGGWGTTLKPAAEEWWLFRKPLSERTIIENLSTWGTGAINIDACRISVNDGDYNHPGNLTRTSMARIAYNAAQQGAQKVTKAPPHSDGRFPANVILDEEAGKMLPKTRPTSSGVRRNKSGMGIHDKGTSLGRGEVFGGYDDNGSASRFFYCPKSSKRDRDEGCDELDEVECGTMDDDSCQWRDKPKRRNFHPTAKSTELMRYLCRLVTPPGGVVLDPFMGSGSTGKAAIIEGFQFIGIEMDEDYMKIAEARIQHELEKSK